MLKEELVNQLQEHVKYSNSMIGDPDATKILIDVLKNRTSKYTENDEEFLNVFLRQLEISVNDNKEFILILATEDSWKLRSQIAELS